MVARNGGWRVLVVFVALAFSGEAVGVGSKEKGRRARSSPFRYPLDP